MPASLRPDRGGIPVRGRTEVDVANRVMSFVWTILAQEPAPGPTGLSGQGLMLGMFGAVAVMLFMQYRSQRGEHDRRVNMLKSLKKGDPVLTTSGILGTIVSVAEDFSELVVKVDENCRLRMKPDAIRDVITKPEHKG